MNKREQYLIEGIIKDILGYLIEDQGMTLQRAIEIFYNSQTFARLTNPDTGLYIESASYVYEIFKQELRNGKI